MLWDRDADRGMEKENVVGTEMKHTGYLLFDCATARLHVGKKKKMPFGFLFPCT